MERVEDAGDYGEPKRDGRDERDIAFWEKRGVIHGQHRFATTLQSLTGLGFFRNNGGIFRIAGRWQILIYASKSSMGVAQPSPRVYLDRI